MKHLDLTEAVQVALAALERAERDFVPGRDPSSIVDVYKIDVADAVVAALAQQRAARLPRRADRGIVYVRLQRARRKPA